MHERKVQCVMRNRLFLGVVGVYVPEESQQ